MIKKSVLLFLLCAVFQSAHAQRIIEKSLVNKHARFFYIDSSLAYEVLLVTNKSHEISIRAIVEGEYQNGIMLNVQESGSDLFISTSFSPEFRIKNDKLSAHKVISVKLEIAVPEKHSVLLKGNYTNLNAKGLFKLLEVDLEEGSCYLDQTSGDIRVNTKSGEIVLESNKGYVEAASQYGSVETDQLPLGEAVYKLNSTSGNIRVIRKL